MPITLHWFLPTNGDSRADLSLGNAVGHEGTRIRGAGGADRAPDIGYLGQIARAAEQMGFAGALTPTSSWCEEGWVTTAALSQLTSTFKFLIAFRPGLTSPTLAAQMAATYQRISGGRLLLNVVTGGDDHEQRRYGDHLGKVARYARADEFLAVVRELWTGNVVDFRGAHYDIQGAQLPEVAAWPEIYLGGSSREAFEVAARRADVYLTWGEPPAAVAEKVARARDAAAAAGRVLRFGIRLHAIARDTADEAWAEADRLLRGLDPERIRRAQETQRRSGSEGQRRMTALHNGRTDGLEVSPNLWAGVGLVRGGAGTALVGSHTEAYRVGEGVLPELRRRGLLVDPADTAPTSPDAAALPAP